MRVRIEQQIGTGGVFQAAAYVKLLVGFDFRAASSRPAKSHTRWRPLSVQAEGGNVWLADGEPGMKSLCRRCANFRGDTMTRQTQ